MRRPPKPSLGAPRRPNGIYAIRMKNTINGPREKDYLRGFGFQGGGSDELPDERARLRRGVQESACSIR